MEHGSRLPRADGVSIPRSKIVDYLLSDTHPAGRAKARFFRRFGFRSAEWRELASALRHHARTCNVVAVDQTVFGERYVIEGPLPSPDGRNPNITSVWFVEKEGDPPRLVTAYPSSEARR